MCVYEPLSSYLFSSFCGLGRFVNCLCEMDEFGEISVLFVFLQGCFCKAVEFGEISLLSLFLQDLLLYCDVLRGTSTSFIITSATAGVSCLLSEPPVVYMCFIYNSSPFLIAYPSVFGTCLLFQ